MSARGRCADNAGRTSFRDSFPPYRATTDRLTMIVQTTGKFKIFATRFGIEAGACRPKGRHIRIAGSVHKMVKRPSGLPDGRRGSGISRPAWLQAPYCLRQPTASGKPCTGRRPRTVGTGLSIPAQSGKRTGTGRAPEVRWFGSWPPATVRGLPRVVPKTDGAAFQPGQIQSGRHGGETAHPAHQAPNVGSLVRSVFEHDGSTR